MRDNSSRTMLPSLLPLLASAGAVLFYAAIPLLSLAFVLQPAPLRASLAVETHDLLEFEYQQVGANEEEAVRLACLRAVNATLGHVLFSDYSLQARDLLDPYIQKNWPKFTASYHVLERRFDRTGFGCRIRVQTFPEILTRDLREKKFLYLPKPNPYHYIYIAEQVEGQPVATDLARQTAMEVLRQEGGNVTPLGSAVPPDNAYVLASPATLLLARQAATRLGAEIIVTGWTNTSKVAEEQIFYDTIHTYETTVHLDMLRVDDGTLLGSVEAVERASATRPEEALGESVRAAVADASAELTAKTRGVWPKASLDQGKFSLLFTDVSPEETEALRQWLESRLSFGTRTWTKTFYGNVAVVNVDTPRAFSAMERALLDFKAFDLRITNRQGRRITVSAKH